MTVRKWLAAAAVSTGTVLGASAADDPAKPDAPKPDSKAVYAFGALKPTPAADAKAKLLAWLKETGKLDQAKFDAVWAGEPTPGTDVHERTVRTILLGLPDADKLLAEAKTETAPAPLEVPPLLTDPKLDPFVRSNLAAAYAKALSGKRVFEESLDAAKLIRPEQVVDPAGYYFYKAVAEHGLGPVGPTYREAAVVSIGRLLDDVADVPDRYRVVATMMFFDVQNWSADAKDLANITRLMDNSGRRLDLARGGPQTQEIQKKIVFNLDEKIKQMEEEQKKKQQGQGGGQGQQPGQQPGPASGPPNGPAGDSTPNGGMNGSGKVDDKALRKYEAQWGTLPEAERKKVVQDITRDLPPKYKAEIENYFRELNKLHGYKP